MASTLSGRPPVVAVPSPNSPKIDPVTIRAKGIRDVLASRLAGTKGQRHASEVLKDSEVHLVGNQLQFRTNLSKAMLPVVVNAEATRLMKAVLAEYHMPGIDIALIPAPKIISTGEIQKTVSANQEAVRPADDPFTRLSITASRLNSMSDLLSEQVSQIDVALKRLNLGVTAWVKVKYEEDEDGNCYSEHVGYAKVGNRWCVTLRTISGMRGDPSAPDISLWPFIDAPRQVRMRAAHYLPELIEALCKEADKLIDQLTPKVEELIHLAAALSRTGGGR